MHIELKRAYEAASPADGYRVLVDRLWPRGVSKEELEMDYWAKDLAPSTELRKWFAHDPAKWPEFQKRYQNELESNPEGVAELRHQIAGHNKVTFVYGARDTEHNEALVLKKFME